MEQSKASRQMVAAGFHRALGNAAEIHAHLLGGRDGRGARLHQEGCREEPGGGAAYETERPRGGHKAESVLGGAVEGAGRRAPAKRGLATPGPARRWGWPAFSIEEPLCAQSICSRPSSCCPRPSRLSNATRSPRSEERRVGKECRSRWSPY